MTVSALSRPFLLSFTGPGRPLMQFAIGSDEANSVLRCFPIIRATAHKVVLRHVNGTFFLTPATLGGGPAFEVAK